tara:strand:- start:4860 stop:5078 length:219 start_codon:yes stop_codon:yes gene_type:complete
MKLEIDSQILEVTKTIIVSSIASLKGLSHSQNNLVDKTLINSCVDCLKQAHNNLDEHANKPKPIRRLAISSK